jgi:serine phosphatase RsbU (regulator of sigma subunit)
MEISVALAPGFSVSEMQKDSSPSVGFEKIIADRYSSYGYSDQELWIRISIYNDTPSEEFILSLGNRHFDKIEMYQSSRNYMDPIRSGDLIPFRYLPIQEANLSLPIRIQPGESDLIFLRIVTTSTITFLPKLAEPEKYYQTRSQEKMILGLFFGSIGIMILYNLVVFSFLREKTYLFYSLSIFFNLLIQTFLTGIDYPYFFANHPELRNHIPILYVGFGSIFGIYFVRTYLNTRSRMPFLDQILRIAAWVLLGVSFLVYFCFSLKEVVIFGNLIAQIFSLLVLIASIRGVILGLREARLFLFGWGLLLIGIISWTLLEAGILPYNFFTVHSNQLGSVMEALILSLALADRINLLKKEKENEREKALADLEVKVKERTKKLDQTLQAIQKDIHMARKIQEDSIPSPDLDFDRLEFPRFYKPMAIIGGDFFDAFEKSQDQYRIFLADATGHGVQAALITMAIRSEYEGLKTSIQEPGQLLSELNKIFLQEYKNLHIIFTCAVVDIYLDQKKIVFASAGHPDQILIRDGNLIPMPHTGRIIGLAEGSCYRSAEFPFHDSDRIFLFSDGILEESHSPTITWKGEESLYTFLEKRGKLPIQETVRELEYQLIQAWREEDQRDDVTFLGIQKRPGSCKV